MDCLELRNTAKQCSLMSKPKEKQEWKASTFERLCLGKTTTPPFSLVFEDKPKGRKGSVIQGMKLQAGGQQFCTSIFFCPVSVQEVPQGSRELHFSEFPWTAKWLQAPSPFQICLLVHIRLVFLHPLVLWLQIYMVLSGVSPVLGLWYIIASVTVSFWNNTTTSWVAHNFQSFLHNLGSC